MVKGTKEYYGNPLDFAIRILVDCINGRGTDYPANIPLAYRPAMLCAIPSIGQVLPSTESTARAILGPDSGWVRGE